MIKTVLPFVLNLTIQVSIYNVYIITKALTYNNTTVYIVTHIVCQETQTQIPIYPFYLTSSLDLTYDVAFLIFKEDEKKKENPFITKAFSHII